MNRFSWFIVGLVLAITTSAIALNVNGELKVALLELLASDPVSQVEEGRIYYNTTAKQAKIYNGSSWAGLGGGSGAGGIFHIDNYNFENGTVTDWSVFDDGAVSEPVDGEGAGATVAFTHTSTASEVLRGSGSAKFSKDAADRQGEGFSVDFSFDRQDKQKLMGLSMDYSTTADYADGDVGIWIICDVDGTPQLLTPQEGSGLPATGGGLAPHVVTVLLDITDDDHLDCRLSGMVTNTDAVDSWDITIDEVKVGPGVSKTTPVVGDWVTFIPTYFNTPPSLDIESGAWRRVGDTMEIKVTLRADGGGSPSGNLQIAFPSGLNPDAGSLPSAAGGYATVGSAIYRDVGANESIAGNVVIDTGTSKFLFIFPGTAAFTGWSQLGGANDVLSFVATVPIAEWKNEGVTHLLDGDVPAQNARARFYRATNQTGESKVKYDTVSSKINNGGYTVNDPADGDIKVPANGTYFVSAHVQQNGGTFTTGSIRLHVNGSFDTYLGPKVAGENSAVGTAMVELSKGDYISVHLSGTENILGSESQTYIDIKRVADITAGTPIGFGIAGDGVYGLEQKNKWAAKEKTSGFTTGTEPDLSFNNLIIGKVYRVSLQIETNGHNLAGARRGYLQAQHNAVGIARLGPKDFNDTGEIFLRPSAIFTAVTTDLDVIVDTSNVTITNAKVYLEELNDYGTETSEFD